MAAAMQTMQNREKQAKGIISHNLHLVAVFNADFMPRSVARSVPEINVFSSLRPRHCLRRASIPDRGLRAHGCRGRLGCLRGRHSRCDPSRNKGTRGVVKITVGGACDCLEATVIDAWPRTRRPVGLVPICSRPATLHARQLGLTSSTA